MDDHRRYALSHTLALCALVVLTVVLAYGVVQAALADIAELTVARVAGSDSPYAAQLTRTVAVGGFVVFALMYFSLGYWLARHLYGLQLMPAVLTAIAAGVLLVLLHSDARLPPFDRPDRLVATLRDAWPALIPLAALPLGALRASWDRRQGTLLSFRAGGATLITLAAFGAAFVGLFQALA